MGAPGSLSAAKLPQTPGDPQAAGLEGARAAQVAREDGRGQRPGRSLCGPRKQLCALVFGDHTTGGREETGGDPALGRARPTHAATASSGRGRKAARAPRRAQGPHGAWGREGRPAAPVLVVRSSVSGRRPPPRPSRQPRFRCLPRRPLLSPLLSYRRPRDQSLRRRRAENRSSDHRFWTGRRLRGTWSGCPRGPMPPRPAGGCRAPAGRPAEAAGAG